MNVAKIAVGALLVLALALGAYGWKLAKAPPPSEAPVHSSAVDSKPGVSVVVAARAIPAGQALQVEDLQVSSFPSKPDGAYGDVQVALGSVPAVDIPQGAPVLQGQMVTGLALKVPEGERAVAVKVDETIGAGNRIRPGDFVDVFFILRRDGNEIDQSQARLLLSRKRVLAYGSSSVDALSSAEKVDGKQGHGPDNARTAVLAVPVAEVSQLALGGSSGSLVLALRNPKDTTEPDTEKFPPLAGVLAVAMPKGGGGGALDGADAAKAGVAMSSLAGSAGATTSRASQAKAMPAGIARPSAQGTRTSSSDSSLSVEFVRGANSQTVRY